ncbi:helix-turn-helix domain-containing protein [Brevundimonas sp.]|uniref:helix-turn-helix domain-containing protein n=1 Tax=Brevundimonas sp. TaxID=1871086 RepID=UPI0040337231
MSRRPDEADAHIGRRIAARRQALGLSQDALARRLGLSFQQIQKYESGANRVPASRLNRIAALLGAPIGQFLPGPPVFQEAQIEEEGVHGELTALATAFRAIENQGVRLALVCVVQALGRG